MRIVAAVSGDDLEARRVLFVGQELPKAGNVFVAVFLCFKTLVGEKGP
jgi:hypothetical protein